MKAKRISLFLAGALLMSNAALAESSYTGTARGHNGDVSVEVTFSADKIESINVLENSETPGVSDLPQKQIPEDILTYQSLDVDGITGATLTSNAILAAVADAAQQAGANVNALRAVPVDKPVAPVQDLTTQVVVVGAGSAGLTAASKAADEGAQVVLVEKMPYVGGSLLLSAGGHATATANEFGKQNNVTVDLADTMDWVRTANATASHQPDYDFIEYLLSQTGETMDLLYAGAGHAGLYDPAERDPSLRQHAARRFPFRRWRGRCACRTPG